MTIDSATATPMKIEPQITYTLASFIATTGLSYSRIRRAAHDGVEIPTFAIGRRKFIKGSAAIAYIDQLAQQTSKRTSSEASFQGTLAERKE